MASSMKKAPINSSQARSRSEASSRKNDVENVRQQGARSTTPAKEPTNKRQPNKNKPQGGPTAPPKPKRRSSIQKEESVTNHSKLQKDWGEIFRQSNREHAPAHEKRASLPVRLIGPLPMPSGIRHDPDDEDSGSNAALEIPMKPKRSRSLTELDTIASAEPLSSMVSILPTPEEAAAALKALAERPQIVDEVTLPAINMPAPAPAGPSTPQINCELYATISENNINADENNILMGGGVTTSRSGDEIDDQLGAGLVSPYPRVRRVSCVGLNEDGNEVRVTDDDAKMQINDVEESALRRGSMAGTANLSDNQIQAFREVFELFDSNGGGTIDAEELDQALQSVGIQLDPNDIREVMLMLDDDGNGEIDFEEFLKIMTNTERFLQSLAIKRSQSQESLSPNARQLPPPGAGKENVLFEALTEFMKKSALKSVGEIASYYHSKYRRVQVAVPHVVNHYAAGARLIGLSTKQIKQHLERLKGAAKARDLKSPYAHPLHIMTSQSSLQHLRNAGNGAPAKGRRGSQGVRRGRAAIRNSNWAKIFRQTKCGVIKLCVRFGVNKPMNSTNNVAINREEADMAVPPAKLLPTLVNVESRGYGWVGQRAEHIEAKLDDNYLRQYLPFDEVTAEDLPNIRQSVTAATHSYCKRRRKAAVTQNLQHWKALDSTSLIAPGMLREHYKTVFSHYSSVKLSLLNEHQGRRQNQLKFWKENRDRYEADPALLLNCR